MVDLHVTVLNTAKIAVRTLNDFSIVINTSLMKETTNYFITEDGSAFKTSEDNFLTVK